MIALARHGETTWNKGRRFQGQLDVELNDTGRAQARALATAAAGEGFAAIYTSPLVRARETGTAGIARPDGELRQGLIDEIAHAVNSGRTLSQAPLNYQ